MNSVVAIAIALPLIQYFGAQAALSIVTYDVECVVADPEYFKDIETYVEDEGRDNEIFVNLTLIKSLPENSTVSLKMIGSSMGEFKVPTGIDFTLKLCDAAKEPIFGNRLYKAAGFDKNVCPAPPGVYGGSHINLVDQETLPETFPSNDYMMVVTALYEKRILYCTKTYFKVQ